MLLCVVFGMLLLPWGKNLNVGESLLKPSAVWAGLWPVIAGVALWAACVRPATRWLERFQRNVPPGDLVVVFEYGFSSLRWAAANILTILLRALQYVQEAAKPLRARLEAAPRALGVAEDVLRCWPIGGGLMIGVFVVILIAMLWR